MEVSKGTSGLALVTLPHQLGSPEQMPCQEAGLELLISFSVMAVNLGALILKPHSTSGGEFDQTYGSSQYQLGLISVPGTEGESLSSEGKAT